MSRSTKAADAKAEAKEGASPLMVLPADRPLVLAMAAQLGEARRAAAAARDLMGLISPDCLIFNPPRGPAWYAAQMHAAYMLLLLGGPDRASGLLGVLAGDDMAITDERHLRRIEALVLQEFGAEGASQARPTLDRARQLRESWRGQAKPRPTPA